MTEALRELIIDERAGRPNCGEQAISEGMSTLRQSGLQKVRDGMTTLEEVVRETM